MVAPAPPTSAWLLIAAFLAAAGCVGAGSLQRAVQIESGKRTMVQLVQFGSGPSVAGKPLSLQNASSVATSATGTSAPDALTKVVDDEQLQALLDVFAEKGVFASGAATVPPDAQDALVVSHGGKRWVMSRRKVGLQSEELAFHEAKAYFITVWNSATAYRGTGKGRPDWHGDAESKPLPELRSGSGSTGSTKAPKPGSGK